MAFCGVPSNIEVVTKKSHAKFLCGVGIRCFTFISKSFFIDLKKTMNTRMVEVLALFDDDKVSII